MFEPVNPCRLEKSTVEAGSRAKIRQACEVVTKLDAYIEILTRLLTTNRSWQA